MKELLAIAAQHSIPLQGGDLSPSTPKHPVIVVEGLDAAGVYMYMNGYMSVCMSDVYCGCRDSLLRMLNQLGGYQTFS